MFPGRYRPTRNTMRDRSRPLPLAAVTYFRIALAQVNPTVGDLAGNTQMMLDWAARADDVDLLVFPEMALTGYPIEDLALRPSFQRAAAAALVELAAGLNAVGLGQTPVVVGSLSIDSHGRPLNIAAVIYRGDVAATYHKHRLPNYGVFDEFRYFSAGTVPLTLRIAGIDVGIAICEDIWSNATPQPWDSTADLLVVLNGSPFERRKDDERLDLCVQRARQNDLAVAYVNLVGGQDELVFDGDSLVVDRTGQLIARAPQFIDGLMTVDLDLPTGTGTDAKWFSDSHTRDTPPLTPGVAIALDDDEELYEALVLGLSDYVRKNGFHQVALGLSGGIDSALVAAIACDALGADRVIGVSMPSKYSSAHSQSDAAQLAERTGLNFRTVPIAEFVHLFTETLQLSGLAEENVQARVRGVTLMAISNAEGPLVLATGNKSELAVGYSTIYGDAVGGFAPIKDVTKTQVWQLSRWRNAIAVERGEIPPIPPDSITKPPSAELRPDQQDSDSLPDYEILDQLLDLYVEGDRGASDLVSAGFAPDLVEQVIALVDRAEYKRRQYPPGTKVSAKAFGRDRRLPITHRWREQGF